MCLIVHWQVTAVRATLKVLPAPLRERLAARLFVTARRHREPERELDWRSRGEAIELHGHQAVSFGDGPAVLLMHGWEGRGLQLAAFIDPLVAAGHRVIALDGPGHGKNQGLPGLPTFSRLLEQCIASEQPVAIIAHSMGAGAAILAASRSDFDGHVLCLGGPAATPEVFRRAREFMGLPESGLPRFMEALRRIYGDVPDDVMDIAGAATRCRHLHAVLAAQDDDVPAQESRRIVEGGGGTVTVVADATHRSVMWAPEAVQAGLQAIGIRLVR